MAESVLTPIFAIITKATILESSLGLLQHNGIMSLRRSQVRGGYMLFLPSSQAGLPLDAPYQHVGESGCHLLSWSGKDGL